MVVARLSKITLFVPRSEMPIASGYIAEIEQFHPIPVETDTYDKRLSELASISYRISSELTFIIDNMGLSFEPPAIRKAFGGIKYDKTEIEAENWQDFVTKLESRASPLIQSLGELIRQRRALEKKRDDLSALQRAIAALSLYNVDLGAIGSMKHFKAEFVIVNNKDLEELKKSIPESTVISSLLSERESAVLIIGTPDQTERISKTLRSFDAKSITVPKELPQIPSEAYKAMGEQLDKIRNEISRNEAETEQAVRSTQESMLGLRESADVAFRILDELKKSGKLKRISMISGYVPTNLVQKLESRVNGKWPMLKTEVDPYQSYAEGMHEAETGDTETEQPPTLFSNRRKPVVAHQAVTLTSGPPVYGEVDPTPILAVTFPIFYGLMFGDLGHGALLMLVGGLIYLRGTYDVKNWGILLLMAGICASIVGILVGEIFGFELVSWVPALKPLVLFPLKQGSLAFNEKTVLFFIKYTIYIGIIDIFLGMVIAVYNKLRTGDYAHLVASILPTISGYSFFLIFGFAFKAAKYSLSSTLNGSNMQANIGLVGLVASIIWLFVSGPMLVRSGKMHGSVMSEVGAATMEFLEWVVSKFVGNTVSYVRLSILLIVHAALLAATNLLYFSYGAATIPALVVMNLLIFAFEGLIVYVQSLRLHLYEFFSKFYLGTGREFSSISPIRQHSVIKWGKGQDTRTSTDS